jgi:hypothetical protein
MMTMRRVALAIGLATLIVSGYYVLAYLYWWEWNRAAIAGVFFIATEVAIGILVVLGRIERLEHRIDANGNRGRRLRTVDILHANAPEPRDRFAWLDPRKATHLNVFVPILLGAGVILSGIAWLVERIARALGDPGLERDLAARLDRLSPPPGGFLEPREGLGLRPYRR